MCVACGKNEGWKLKTYYGEMGMFPQNMCKACSRVIFSDIMNVCFDSGTARSYGHTTYDKIRFVVSEGCVRAAVREAREVFVDV